MNAGQAQTVAIGCLFLLVFGSGYWLSRSARRRGAVTLTLHKLLSLAAAALLGLVAYESNRAVRLSAIEWTSVVAAGLFFLGTVITGGLLSTDHAMPRLVRTLHRITPFLTALATALAWYVLGVIG